VQHYVYKKLLISTDETYININMYFYCKDLVVKKSWLMFLFMYKAYQVTQISKVNVHYSTCRI